MILVPVELSYEIDERRDLLRVGLYRVRCVDHAVQCGLQFAAKTTVSILCWVCRERLELVDKRW